MNGAELSIIHVIEPLPYASDELITVYNYEELSKATSEIARKRMQPVKERLAVLDSQLLIATGHVSTEILLYAEKKEVDLIITGSHGRHGLQLLLGSTANAILHGAKCDVLAVRFKE